MKVKVNAGYQLGPDDGSKLYYEGDTFDVPDALAQAWIAGGLAVAVKADTPKKAKAVKASKNKAVAVSPNKAIVPGFVAVPKVEAAPIMPVVPSNK